MCSTCDTTRKKNATAAKKKKAAKEKAAAAATPVPKMCPRCGALGVTKVNRYTKKEFTGCSAWPNCTWTMNGVYMSKVEIGKQIKFQTNAGAMVGTVVGQNDNKNFILKVDKRSPVQGFRLSPDTMYTVSDHVSFGRKTALNGHTFWHLSQTEEVADATEADLLPEEAKEYLEEKSSTKALPETWEDKPAVAVAATEVKETKMTEKKTAFQIVKSDGEEAAYRVAGKRISQGGSTIVCKVLKNSLGPEHGASVEAIMKSPAGVAFTQLVMGWGITMAGQNVGGMAADPRLQKLAAEFRIQGTAEGLDMVVGGVMEHLMPVLNDALALLPGGEEKTVTNARIAAPTESPAVDVKAEEELLELSDVLVEGKKAVAGK